MSLSIQLFLRLAHKDYISVSNKLAVLSIKSMSWKLAFVFIIFGIKVNEKQIETWPVRVYMFKPVPAQ